MTSNTERVLVSFHSQFHAECNTAVLQYDNPNVTNIAHTQGHIGSHFILFCPYIDECETWSLTLREERRLRVFENRVLRKIFGPKRDKVTGEWKKLHNEELNDLYSSPNIFRVIKSRRMRWAGHVVVMGERRDVYRVLM